MVLRNAIIEAELVEQLALVPPLPTHHRPSSVADVLSRRNHRSAPISTPLSTASTRGGHIWADLGRSVDRRPHDKIYWCRNRLRHHEIQNEPAMNGLFSCGSAGRGTTR